MQAIETAPSQASYTADIQQYLSFALGDEQYGIEILRVQEIKGYSGITPIPNTPAHIRGVMNLRGTVIPVVDLRAKFRLETHHYDKFTVIIVVTVGARIVRRRNWGTARIHALSRGWCTWASGWSCYWISPLYWPRIRSAKPRYCRRSRNEEI